MMYPRKTPKQAKEAEEIKKHSTLQQREQLLLLASQKFPSRYPLKDPEVKLEHYASEGHKTVSSDKLKTAHHHHAHHTHEDGAESDRDDLSVKSDHSKMSGATDKSEEELNNTGLKKEARMIDMTWSTKTLSPKKYKNDEEEWAAIYKANQEAYNSELQLTKDRKAFEKRKFRDELDDQVVLNNDKRERQLNLKRLDHEQVMKRVERDELKEKKRKELEQAKMAFSKQTREEQMKTNKAQRKHDQKEQRMLDEYIINRIREEQMEEDRVAKKKRQEDEANYRRLLAENQVKRHQILEAKSKEREAEVKQIEVHVKLVEIREKARADELKAKDERIRRNIELARELIAKPQDEKDKKQESKVRKWNEKREQEDLQADMEAKQFALQRRNDHRAFLEHQISEAKLRKDAEKNRRNDQLEIWRVANEKHADWEKTKQTEKKEQMKLYHETLQHQMQEKFEERRVTDRLFDLRQSLEENRRALVK